MVAKIAPPQMRVLALTVGDLDREIRLRDGIDAEPLGVIDSDGRWSQGARLRLMAYNPRTRQVYGPADDPEVPETAAVGWVVG